MGYKYATPKREHQEIKNIIGTKENINVKEMCYFSVNNVFFLSIPPR